MRKRPFPVLLTVTLIFAAFTLGFYTGRSQCPAEISVASVSTAPGHGTSLSLPDSTDAVEEPVQLPLNINTASREDLMQLPGIGEVLADRIILYRSANGPFSAPEELLNVEGIGGGKFTAIMDLITTGG